LHYGSQVRLPRLRQADYSRSTLVRLHVERVIHIGGFLPFHKIRRFTDAPKAQSNAKETPWLFLLRTLRYIQRRGGCAAKWGKFTPQRPLSYDLLSTSLFGRLSCASFWKLASGLHLT